MSARERISSVLLVDIGNTRIKCAIWRDHELGSMRAGEFAGWGPADYARHVFRGAASHVSRIVVSSVADGEVVQRLTIAARRSAGVVPEILATSRRAAGVETRYTEPWRLGVDRFMGIIAAHHLAGARAACVINVGTAVTVDYVDGRGVHHGGAILPGVGLMIGSLLSGTAGIAHRAQQGPHAPQGPQGSGEPRGPVGPRGWRGPGGATGTDRPPQRSRPAASLFARSTAAAIAQGAWHSVAAIVEHAVAECRGRLGTDPLVILTGGGARQVMSLIASPHVEIPDLVLRGIALRAGLELR